MALQTANQFQLGTDFSQAGRGFQQGQQFAAQRQLGEQREVAAGRATTEFDRGETQFQQEQSIQRAGILNQSARALKSLPVEQREAALRQLAPRLAEFNIDATVFEGADLSDAELDQAIASTQGLLADPQAATKLGLQKRTLDIREKELGQRRELKELAPELAGLTEEKKLEAQIKLKPTLEGKLEKVKGDVKASADIVTESFKRIGKISTNIRNIDRAINAINRGAKTGVIAKLIPNITAASRELRQIQNELGLDVIGSVTFGALSQGELDLALETAIDLGLQPEALKDVLTRKKAAQNKLIAYLDEQIQFLDDGGTLAGWRAQLTQAVTTDLTQISDEDLAAQLEAARASQGGQ